MKDNTILTGKDLGLTTVKGRMLTLKEVAAFLRISERFIRDLIQRGDFPIAGYNISPRCRKIASEDLDNYLAKIKAEAGTATLPARALRKIQTEEVITMT